MKIFFILLILFTVSCSTSFSDQRKAIIYLHGMGSDPIKGEQLNINRLKYLAEKNNFEFILPRAQGNCSYLKKKRKEQICWDHLNINKELGVILEKVKGYREIIILGFSNGGYLLGGALQRGYLNNVSKVGILSGGGIGTKVSHKRISPKVFIEVGKKDEWNKKWGLKLKNMLSRKSENVIYYREIDRSHFPIPAVPPKN
jgi:predicted esterase